MPNSFESLKKSIQENEISIDLHKLEEAYEFVKKNLGDKKRHTGETYIDHSVKSAIIISEIKADSVSILSCLLHEAAYRNPDLIPEISKIFGPEVSLIIQKFNALGEIRFNENPKFRENIKKMIIGISEDLRVITIKLATFYEHLKTCKTLPKEEQIESAKQGMLIYAPIADLLGIWDLRWKIEDAAFEILNPKEYIEIHNKFYIKKKKEQERYIENLREILKIKCDSYKLPCQIEGRYKHIYSIYKKMKDKRKKFNEIYDVFALRVIVSDIPQCYQLLGIIHSLWKPYLQRIKDYIAQPKPNGYQSLHTTVFGPGGLPAEFQIRTIEMHETSEFGVAAHWKYKNASKSIMQNTRWVTDILKMKKRLFEDSTAIALNNKLDIFKSRIFVFTPKGDVIDLPEKATPVDFAYYIHSEIGRKCAGCLVNNLPAKLSQPLKNNDMVEIVLDENQKYPDERWLTFVVSSHARRKINNHINKNA